MWEIVSSLSAIIVPSFVCYVSIRNSNKITNQQEVNRLRELEETKKSLLFGFKTEIESIYSQYMVQCGNNLNNHQKGQVFQYIFPVNQNYFSFYESNTRGISSLDAELVVEIITLYNNMKGLLDTFHLHNDMLMNNLNIYAYSDKLKDQHDKLLIIYQKCMTAIQRYD